MTVSQKSNAREAALQVRSNFGFAWLNDYCPLEITGADAPKFLQNRLSNDVLALQPGQGHLNAVLDRQGKIEGVFSLHRTPDGFLAIVERAAAEAAIKGILKYRIVEQVSVTDASERYGLLTIQGPGSAAFLSEFLAGASSEVDGEVSKDGSDVLSPDGLAILPEYGRLNLSWRGMGIHLIRRSLTGETGYILAVPTNGANGQAPEPLPAMLKQSALERGGVEMIAEIREVLRIEAGQPRFGLDYDTGTLLPETGLEREAVSYSKGCYLGQETIARIRTYGMVQQALCGLVFEPDTPLPLPIGEVRLAGKSTAVLKSGTFSPKLGRPIALAYLGKTDRVPGKSLSLTAENRTYIATVSLLPFPGIQAQRQSGRTLLAEGLKLFSEGYDEEAIRMLRQAIDATPGLVDAYEALGVILSRQERFDEAIALMNRILELDSDHVLAHTNLSVFYMKLGDKEKAEEEKAKATMAAFSRRAKEAGLAFDMEAERLKMEAERRKKEAAALERIAMFLEALKYNPDDPLGNFGLGSAYLELKRYAEAVEPFEKVIMAQPKHSVAYLSLGKALENAGEKSRARETYEKGIEVAAGKGDLMPLQEMQTRLSALNALS